MKANKIVRARLEEESENMEVILDGQLEKSKECIRIKKFEDMNEDELKNEFLKRNMKLGRIKKKSTFILKLHEYEESKNKE